MFSFTLRRSLWFCDKVIIRDIRTRRLPPANPGLDHRISAFRKEGAQIKAEDVDEYVEEPASDFQNVGEEYNELMNETLIGKHKLRHHIIKEKYFKENMPNLLTWSEKEQIRHLANTDPHEWTPEKLAESFPVTVPVVKKLLKYPWKPATEERIARHDTSAMRNWRELKEGSFHISEELRQRFLKFSERKLPPLKKESIKKLDLSPEKIGEFEQIIRKCAAKDESYKPKTEHKQSETATTFQSTRKYVKDTKRTTLEELSAKIKNRLEQGNEIQMQDQIIIDSVNSEENTLSDNIQVSKEIVLSDETSKINSITESKFEDSNTIKPVATYPERIRIPKKAYKKGATYKVNECFYDHDGRFLYRVIGLDN